MSSKAPILAERRRAIIRLGLKRATTNQLLAELRRRGHRVRVQVALPSKFQGYTGEDVVVPNP